VQGKGFFITFEGLDGCGKSTQALLLKEYLEGEGMDVVLTREPGGTPIGEKLRELVLDIRQKGLTYTTEVFLYAASRAQHMAEVVLPSLAQDKIVICDRFTDSTVAYQGFGCGLDIEVLGVINQFASCGVSPHLTVLIDIPVAKALQRIGRTEGATGKSRIDRIEERGFVFYNKVRKGYLFLAEQYPKRIEIVRERGRSIEGMHSAIKALVMSRLGVR
jgi:dTMP kinase